MTRRSALTALGALALTAAPAAAEPPAVARLREVEAGFGRIGVAALDTGTGRRVRYRAHERFAMCSTFKVLASSAILRQAHGTDLLERRVTYRAEDLVPNSPITSKHVDTGMTVADLCAAALTYSDNTAANLLLDILGGPGAVSVFARTLGDPVTRLDRRETELNTNLPGDPRDTSTPAAMAADLHRLTLGSALPAPARTRLVDWLKANTTGATRLKAGLPPTWVVGDKTGSGDYGAINDLAIVWPPDRAPIIIAAYTSRTRPDQPGDPAVVAEIGRVVADTLGR